MTGHCPHCEADIEIDAYQEHRGWAYEIKAECEHEFSDDVVEDIIHSAKRREAQSRYDYFADKDL